MPHTLPAPRGVDDALDVLERRLGLAANEKSPLPKPSRSVRTERRRKIVISPASTQPVPPKPPTPELPTYTSPSTTTFDQLEERFHTALRSVQLKLTCSEQLGDAESVDILCKLKQQLNDDLRHLADLRGATHAPPEPQVRRTAVPVNYNNPNVSPSEILVTITAFDPIKGTLAGRDSARLQFVFAPPPFALRMVRPVKLSALWRRGEQLAKPVQVSFTFDRAAPRPVLRHSVAFDVYARMGLTKHQVGSGRIPCEQLLTRATVVLPRHPVVEMQTVVATVSVYVNVQRPLDARQTFDRRLELLVTPMLRHASPRRRRTSGAAQPSDELLLHSRQFVEDCSAPRLLVEGAFELEAAALRVQITDPALAQEYRERQRVALASHRAVLRKLQLNRITPLELCVSITLAMRPSRARLANYRRRGKSAPVALTRRVELMEEDVHRIMQKHRLSSADVKREIAATLKNADAHDATTTRTPSPPQATALIPFPDPKTIWSRDCLRMMETALRAARAKAKADGRPDQARVEKERLDAVRAQCKALDALFSQGSFDVKFYLTMLYKGSAREATAIKKCNAAGVYDQSIEDAAARRGAMTREYANALEAHRIDPHVIQELVPKTSHLEPYTLHLPPK